MLCLFHCLANDVDPLPPSRGWGGPAPFLHFGSRAGLCEEVLDEERGLCAAGRGPHDLGISPSWVWNWLESMQPEGGIGEDV